MLNKQEKAFTFPENANTQHEIDTKPWLISFVHNHQC